MNQKETAKYLNNHLFTEISIDDRKQVETFYQWKKEIHIYINKDISITLNYSNDPVLGYSAICADGYQLEASREQVESILVQYVNCKITRKQIAELCK